MYFVFYSSRKYGHRAKSVSMATFKPEEVRGMEEGGNHVAANSYLAKWNSSVLPKPIERYKYIKLEW